MGLSKFGNKQQIEGSSGNLVDVNSDGQLQVLLSALADAVKGQQDQVDALVVTPAKDNYDEITRALNIIDYGHHEIHEGSSFMVHFDNTTASSDDDRTAIAFTAPDSTKWSHMVTTIYASHPAEFSILEDPATLDNDEGTETTVMNRNRNSDNTSGMLSIEDPAVANLATTFTEAQIAGAQLTGGTEIEHTILKGGDGPKAVGGESRGVQEIILKAGKTYLFIMQNIGANANLHQIHLDWYEHTNKVNT